MLNVFMLSVIMLSVVKLNVVAPKINLSFNLGNRHAFTESKSGANPLRKFWNKFTHSLS